MNTIEPLINDEYTGLPLKRVLAYLMSKKEKGKSIIGTYCGYAPLEIIRAMDSVPAILCAFANSTIEKAEEVLPRNLCPLIKSSYGFIKSDTCPLFSLSEAVIAETTCDGKKKMFELISDIKPLHVMDLPQVPDQIEAQNNWSAMIKKLQLFLENTFNKKITNDNIEAAIKDSNKKNKIMRKIFDYAAMKPSVINWSELYDIILLAVSAKSDDINSFLNDLIIKLDKRVDEGIYFGSDNSPRVLVTGCPVNGDSAKVFKIIEEVGGTIVALDSCTGMKPFMNDIEENSKDPIEAISKKYLNIPCSCMTPNTRRLDELDKIIEKFKPDVVIDVVLHACHSYNIESYKIGKHIAEKHAMPFLKIETDYSTIDKEQIRTRVEALFEGLKSYSMS